MYVSIPVSLGVYIWWKDNIIILKELLKDYLFGKYYNIKGYIKI